MVNHRNISAGESRLRVQLAYISLDEIKRHLNHFHYYFDHRLKLLLSPNIFVGSLTFSLLTKTVSQSVVRLSPLFTNSLVWFDTHIMIMTIFRQPEFKSWPLFVPQSFICQLVSSRSMVHVVGFDIQRDIGGVGCIHTCLTS